MMVENIRKNLIAIAIVVAGVLIAGALIYLNQVKSKAPEGKIGIFSSQEVGQKVVNYINKNFLQEQATASLKEIVEESGLYKVIVKIGDQEFPIYASLNGKLLFPEAIDLEKEISTQKNSNEEVSQEIPKTEKPNVKLFVMSYCPYGLQMEKAFLPVYDLLKGKAEMGIYFVDYIMHEKQEIDENLRQYCIQKEEKEKYYNYLNCFIQDGNFEKCLSETKIDEDKLKNCIAETDKAYKISSQYEDKNTWLNGYYPKFDVHSNLNEKYGIQGSPTLVINEKIVLADRSPEGVKKIICQAFNSPPEECNQPLSETSFSPGFGWEAGSSSSGQCQ